MSVRSIALALALPLTILSAEGSGATEFSSGSQLVVYVEVPQLLDAETELTIARVGLRGESAVQPLDPLVETLTAGRLAGRQLRFIDQTVPPGWYEALEIELGHIEASSGKASVRPQVPAAPLVLPLERQLRRGESALVVIRWTPAVIDPAAPEHVPQLEIDVPVVPPLGSIAFVSNEGSGNVSVVSLASRRVVDVVRAEEGPRGLAYSRLRQRLYVANARSNSLVVIDTPSRRRIQTATASFGDEPSRLALSPDESRLYVLNYGSDVLTVHDAETLQEIARTFVGEEPRSMAVDPGSGLVYVASALDTRVRVFDPARPERETSLPAEVTPAEVVFDRTSNRLHVAGASQRIISVLSIETQAVVERMNLCSPAVGLAYNPRSRRLYASLAGCRELVVLIPDAGLEIESARLADAPGLLSFDPDYRELLVTSPSTDELLFYNVNSLQPVGAAAVGERPYLALVPR